MVDILHLTSIKKRLNIDRKDWEALCKHCGRCCQKKVKCQYLEFKDGKSHCKVYPHRYGKFLKHNDPSIWCNVNEAILEANRRMPEGCPYNKYVGYQIFIAD